ncbi:hypothetical protein [Asanoa siamensis]|uniref:hypothetical protein n=1 Tax=Asanoa siamensis TaxID=926357 RepID=UPI00194329EE|nr:hypothetical protein [Asanoa siamensis]
MRSIGSTTTEPAGSSGWSPGSSGLTATGSAGASAGSPGLPGDAERSRLDPAPAECFAT